MMDGVRVGALLGLGVFCVWWSCWSRPPRVRRSRRRVRELLEKLRTAVEAYKQSDEYSQLLKKYNLDPA